MTDREWHRFHPLSPLIRGGVATVAVVGWVLSQQFDRLFGANPNDPTQGHIGVGALLAVLGVAGIVAAGWASWLVTRYRLGGTTLELHSGLLFRQHRQVRYDRIQAVEIVRPFLARLAGLSEVRVESAGGRDSNVRLAFLEAGHASELRDELMGLAAITDEASWSGADEPVDATPSISVTPPAESPATLEPEEAPAPPPIPVAPGSPEPLAAGAAAAPDGGRRQSAGGDIASVGAHRVLRIPNARLVQSFVYSPTGAFLVVAVPIVLLAFQFRWIGVLPTLGPLTLAVGGRHLGQMVRWFNFDLAQSKDAVRVRHGLSELRTSTLPLHRIQAVELSQNIAWRPVGWWRIEVNVAGVEGRRETETTVLPVGTAHEALAVLRLLLPGGADESTTATVWEAMTGTGPGERFVTSPPRAAWLDPLAWRRHGYAVTGPSVVLRAGVLHRRAQIVPHARIQSLTMRQGPLERLLDLAGVHVISTPGRVAPVLSHLDTDEVERFLNDERMRSGRARTQVSGRGGPGSVPDTPGRSSWEAVAHREQT